MPTPSFGAAGRRGGASRHRPHGHGAQWIFRQRKYLAGTTEGGMCAIKKKYLPNNSPPPPPPIFSLFCRLHAHRKSILFFFFSFYVVLGLFFSSLLPRRLILSCSSTCLLTLWMDARPKLEVSSRIFYRSFTLKIQATSRSCLSLILCFHLFSLFFICLERSIYFLLSFYIAV